MRLARHLTFALVASALAGCAGGPPFDDPFEPYLARSQTITLSAGNAMETNEAIHTIDPWPRYVYNTHIEGDGARLADAVDRYQDVSKLPKAPKPITPLYSETVGITGGGGGGGGGS